jgi:hypothetical protein
MKEQARHELTLCPGILVWAGERKGIHLLANRTDRPSVPSLLKILKFY